MLVHFLRNLLMQLQYHIIAKRVHIIFDKAPPNHYTYR